MKKHSRIRYGMSASDSVFGWIFCIALGAVAWFVFFKLFGIIDWPWYWAVAPLILLCIGAALYGIGLKLFQKKR
jgi:hypothetical protein